VHGDVLLAVSASPRTETGGEESPGLMSSAGNRNKHIQVDFGTGNNNKINFAINSKEELVDIIETVYRGASKGKGLVVSPKDYSTKWLY
jgi:hypothetical protein